MDEIIIALTNWIFDEMNLKELILLDSKLIFSYLLRFFDETEKIHLIILRNQSKIFVSSAKKELFLSFVKNEKTISL